MDTVSIVLSNSNLIALVDEDDAERVACLRWRLGKGYALTSDPADTNRDLNLSNFILGVKGMLDHINGDPLDNRRCNLRPCTSMQNAQNHKKHPSNKSGYKGVDLNGGRWRAAIKHQYRHIFLGYFSDPEDAARAYDAKARELFGEFGRFNFPQEGERSAR